MPLTGAPAVDSIPGMGYDQRQKVIDNANYGFQRRYGYPLGNLDTGDPGYYSDGDTLAAQLARRNEDIGYNTRDNIYNALSPLSQNEAYRQAIMKLADRIAFGSY